MHEDQGCEMSGVTDLAELIPGLSPVLRPGEVVWVTLDRHQLDRYPNLDALATVVEAEGITQVVSRNTADAYGWPYEFVARWITLEVHSSLAAVGLTAVVSQALAEEGISANMLAGYYHDHLLVSADRVDDALAVLAGLSARSEPAGGAH
jgi:hypothetical protein